MRYIALLCGLVVGGCFSLPTAFLNGLAMGGSGYSGYAGYGIGALFVGVVGVSWFGGSWGYTLLAGRARVGGALVLAVWSVCMIFAVSMSAGFVAAHRGETVGERQNQIDAYGRAKSDWERGDAEARAANAAGRGKSTERAEARLQAAKAKLDAGRPAKADAQAEWLSWMSFGYVTTAQAEQVLATWVSVVGELACIAAFTAWSQWPAQSSAPVKTAKVEIEPVSEAVAPPVTKVAEPVTDEKVVDLESRRQRRAHVAFGV